MRFESSLDSLDSSSTFLQSLSFNHSKAFQNTLLLPHISITSVIRDAELHESALFTTTAIKRSTHKHNDGSAMVQDVLKARDADVPALLGAIETLNSRYPVPTSERQQVAMMRHKYETLVDSIAELEGQVDSQRRQLDLLSSGRGYTNEFADDEAMADGDVSVGASASQIVTEEMIRAEEEEVLELEKLIGAKTRHSR